MITKIQYYDDIERESIINENIGKALVREERILEGHFLHFDDNVAPTNIQMQAIQDNQMTMLDVQVSTYEAVLMGGAV